MAKRDYDKLLEDFKSLAYDFIMVVEGGDVPDRTMPLLKKYKLIDPDSEEWIYPEDDWKYFITFFLKYFPLILSFR